MTYSYVHLIELLVAGIVKFQTEVSDCQAESLNKIQARYLKNITQEQSTPSLQKKEKKNNLFFIIKKQELSIVHTTIIIQLMLDNMINKHLKNPEQKRA